MYVIIIIACLPETKQSEPARSSSRSRDRDEPVRSTSRSQDRDEPVRRSSSRSCERDELRSKQAPNNEIVRTKLPAMRFSEVKSAESLPSLSSSATPDSASPWNHYPPNPNDYPSPSECAWGTTTGSRAMLMPEVFPDPLNGYEVIGGVSKATSCNVRS